MDSGEEEAEGEAWNSPSRVEVTTNRVFSELQGIRRSQRRMEVLLGRILGEAPLPDLAEASSTSVVRCPRKNLSVSPMVSYSDSSRLTSSIPLEQLDSTRGSSRRRLVPGTVGSKGSVQGRVSTGVRQSETGVAYVRPWVSRTGEHVPISDANQDGTSYPRFFHSMLSPETNFGEAAGNAASDTFIAATLPLSWPTVLAARSKYEKDKNSSQLTLIKNTVWASSRMHSPAGHRTESVDTQKWRFQRFTISPGSTFHMVFCLFSFIVLLYDFTLIPLVLAWDVPVEGALAVTSFLSVIFWTADMGVNFLTAFYVKGELIFSPAAIAMRYFRTWFFFDFVAMSGDWASTVLQTWVQSNDASRANNMRVIRLVKVARLLRIIGILRMLRFLNVVREYVERQCSGYYRVAMKTVSLILGIMLLTHTLCCVWFAIGKLGPSDTGLRWTDIFDSESAAGNEEVYEYLTSFHWAAAQMTLGATDVGSRNSMERAMNVVCMLIGLIFSCTLVSSLSATLVDFSIAHKDQTQKMESIRKYLKENYVSTTTCMAVEDQVKERLSEERRGQFFEGESSMKKLLSTRLFARLRHEVFLPTINTHPLLRLWGSVHEPTMHRLAVEAFDFSALQIGDDLFAAGSKAKSAYFILAGELEYTQRPDSAPVSVEVVSTVSVGTWLCEAALWSEWIHVGTAVAKQRSTLALLKAEELLKVSSEHAVIKTIVASYGEIYHQKIVSAVPPEAAWPNDLTVPNTRLAQIVISMPKEAQVAIGWNVLHRCGGQLVGLAGWAAKAFGGSLPHQLLRLEEEVTLGRSVVIQVGQEVQRVASVVCVRFVDDHDRVLVQLGNSDTDEDQDDVECVNPVCQLPGMKVEEALSPEEKLWKVLEAKLPAIDRDLLEIENVEREEKMELNRYFWLKTTYFRTIVTIRKKGDWEMECMPLDVIPEPSNYASENSGSMPGSSSMPGRSSSIPDRVNSYKGGLGHCDAQLLDSLLHYKVFQMRDARSYPALYAWLPEEVFEEIHIHANGQQVVAEWISKLAQNFRVRESCASSAAMMSMGLGRNSFPMDEDQETPYFARPSAHRQSRISGRWSMLPRASGGNCSRASMITRVSMAFSSSTSSGHLSRSYEQDQGAQESEDDSKTFSV